MKLEGTRVMAVYCDEPVWMRHHGLSGHLLADTLEELHEFAARLGLDRKLFMRDALVPHYQLPAGRRDEAISLGAHPLDRKAFLARARAVQEMPPSGPANRPSCEAPEQISLFTTAGGGAR